MNKFGIFILIYFAVLIGLIIFKCWIPIGILWLLGCISFIYGLLTSKKCPKDLDDIF